MILNRPERIGFSPDEALCLLMNRNMKEKENRYLNEFEKFALKNGAKVKSEDSQFEDTPFTILQSIGNGTQNRVIPKNHIEDPILESIARINDFEEWYEKMN